MGSEPTNTIPSIRLKFDAVAAAVSKYPNVDADAVETGIAILSVMSEFFGAMDVHYARHGLSRGRFIVLVMLLQERGAGLSPAEMADRARVTRATMTGLIDTLEQNGLVERRDEPTDRRMFRVFLTPKGTETIEGVLPAHFSRIASLLQTLNIEEQVQLRGLLSKVRQAVDITRSNE